MADCAYTNTGQGLHRTIDPADGRTYLYTHFEVPDARRLFATFEQPDLKARVHVHGHRAGRLDDLSNSPTPAPDRRRRRRRDLGVRADAADLDLPHGGRRRRLPHRARLAHDAGRPVDPARRSPAAQSLAAHLDADNIFEITEAGLRLLHRDTFAQPYPFAKYDQVFVPEYNIGAMENVGCVTVVEGTSSARKADRRRLPSPRANTLLHELAHMWFGDLVTMRWWDDLWLKESFATYWPRSLPGRRHPIRAPGPTFANARQGLGPAAGRAAVDASDRRRHPRPGRRLGELRRHHVREGRVGPKQLVAWVGADEFFAGVRHYFADHAWGNTTLADLLGALEQTSGRDLSAWSREWLQTAGPNTLRPAFTLDDDGRYTSFERACRPRAGRPPTLRSHRIAIGLYALVDGALARTAQVELDVVGASHRSARARRRRAAGSGAAQRRRPHVREDPARRRARLATCARTSARSPTRCRARCAGPPPGTWSATRSCRRATFIALVFGGIGSETDIGVVERLLQSVWFRSTSTSLRRRASAETTAAARVARAPPVRGRAGQRHAARVGAVLPPPGHADDDVDALVGLLDGSRADRRPRRRRRSALGVRSRSSRRSAGSMPADIEAELERDRTTTAVGFAAGALAARPSAAAKAQAWSAAADPELTKATLDAIAGFRRAGRSVSASARRRRRTCCGRMSIATSKRSPASGRPDHSRRHDRSSTASTRAYRGTRHDRGDRHLPRDREAGAGTAPVAAGRARRDSPGTRGAGTRRASVSARSSMPRGRRSPHRRPRRST